MFLAYIILLSNNMVNRDTGNAYWWLNLLKIYKMFLLWNKDLVINYLKKNIELIFLGYVLLGSF